MTINQRILLVSRPKGDVTPENFRLEDAAIPEIGDGEVLIRNHYMSLDPYMRGRMDDAKSYTTPQALNQVMGGGTVGEVVKSRNPGFAVGDTVVGSLGWQLYGKDGGKGLRKVDARTIPLSAYLGAVGMPGVTAWFGLNKIIAPKAGESVVVSAASGAVGAVVGQLAKLQGCRVVGVAGGAAKCDVVVKEFGFDACIDYKAGRLAQDLEAATPGGIDGYFDNVGGEVLDNVLKRMNPFGRIAVCGLIATYNGEPMPIHNLRSILFNRLLIKGFIVSEHIEHWPAALAELGTLVASGKMNYKETVANGLASAPQAFMGLLKGKNLGKQVVKLI